MKDILIPYQMLDPEYPVWKARCSTNFDENCVKYFLALPSGDLFAGTQTRRNFAGEYCSNQTRMGETPCEVLCRDSPEACRQERERYCSNATLEQVEDGTRANCACYLPQSEYRKQIERIRTRLGDVVADQLLVAIGSPYCFYAPCSRSIPGLATRLGGCQNVAACLQSVTIDSNAGSNVIAVNACNISTVDGSGGGTTPDPSPTPQPPVGISPWLWWGLGLLLIVFILVAVVLIARSRAKKREEEERERQKLLLTSLLRR